VDAIIEDLINDVIIDGNHSFQDTVLPIGEAKKLYGGRIFLLGYIDVYKLTSYETESLWKCIRKTIEECSEGGKFAVVTGNSIPNYIPVENYLTMFDKALR